MAQARAQAGVQAGGLADWNDLRLLLAVSRARGLAGAARALGVDHSTVFRRLQAVEARLGVPVFERLPGGAYVPADGAARILAAAERVEDEVITLGRAIEERLGRDRGHAAPASSRSNFASRTLPS